MNFAFDKARKYFSDKFPAEITAKTTAIPRDQIVEPKASIAGPALQGLAFSHEESNLKEMYLNLLASAMDARVADSAHPAFVEIIRQLNSEEARLLRRMLRQRNGNPIVEIRRRINEGGSWQMLCRHILNLVDSKLQPTENPRLPAMVDNWIRLGLVHVDYTKCLADKGIYDWVEKRPEYVREKAAKEDEKHKVIYQKGVIAPTSLGEQFALAVGLIDKPLP